MRAWTQPADVIVPGALRSAVGGHPLVSSTLVRRGMTNPSAALAFLDPAHYRPAPSTDLPGLTGAAERIEAAIRTGEPICVWGDFDVDGQTATSLLTGALRDLGAAVSFHVPVRESESHGVNVPALAQIITSGARLVLTCDTGVTAHEAVSYAAGRGVDMVVTDHHQPSDLLPPACAVVNPKLLPEEHPLYDLPGAGVAYELAEALYARSPLARGARAGRAGWGQGSASRHLDLVALGIVADLAVQRRDTRYLLQRGLVALRETRRPGLRLLMESTGLDPRWITEEHISYVLAPRLNAVGRLADANAVIELLTLGEGDGETGELSAAERARARILIDQIEMLNQRRKELCDQVSAAAEAQIARDPELQRAPVLVLSNPAWPAGVIGIVAGQLVERYGKPAVLISAPAGRLARGSARSVDGCNITDAIGASAHLLAGFGGHPMAAGLSIAPERIPEFSRALARTVAGMLATDAAAPALAIDGVVPLSELSLPLVEDLARLAPFGPGNPPLTLVTTDLEIVQQRTVGRHGEHRLLTVSDPSGSRAQVIWWDGAREELPSGRFDLAYTASASDYRGERRVEIVWIDARPSAITAAAEIAPPRPPVQVMDFRRETAPRRILESLRSAGGLAVWREGTTEIPGYDRYALPAADALAIWTAPPGPAELRAALAQASPARIYLFGLDPGLDRPDLFIRRLAGLVRHALREHGGNSSVAAFAAATAQREATVWAGLDWLAARGDIRVLREGDSFLLPVLPVVAKPHGPGSSGQRPQDAHPEPETGRARARLEALLAETAAYRAYFRSAEPQAALAQP